MLHMFYMSKLLKSLFKTLNTNEKNHCWLYLTIHNLIQTEIILDEARKSILESTFSTFRKQFEYE
ncbi:MAG: hypothetical protein Ct9H90mP3_2650 [Flammeovirgaceae bacterium]|nr:MAG: hypothetical protein Ct9H90mP3_2650 [Flammeovirgaceae bacterium]